MKQFAAFLAALLAVTLYPSASMGMARKIPAPSPLVSPVPQTAPVGAFIQVTAIRGATEAEKAEIYQEALLAGEVVKSHCFESFLLPRPMIDLGGLTRDQAVAKVRGASVAVEIELYSAWLSRVVGYRNPGDNVIHKNRRFFAGASPCDRASNDAHEASHIIGFEHSFQPTVSRPFSMPYSINAAFSACCHGQKSSP
jgi:hypothetical protein